ncbi:MAG: cysteine synthase A [Holophagales bacterium]|nr:cysteine synthase A [Holophagales bacterium]
MADTSLQGPSSPLISAAPDGSLRGCVGAVLALIGATPMVRLARLEPEGRGDLFAKVEWLTPGGSIKDRTALGMILWAEEQGLIRPGGTLVEPTAGNTGIGLALVGAQRGYKVILCVAEHYSIEKVRLMEALGGTVVRTPREEGMKGAIERARGIAAEIPGAFIPQQFQNAGNPEIHYRATGPEIWQQMEGRIDAVVIGVGSGGTFTGVARYLKEMDPAIRCVAVETNGSVLQGGQPGPHEVEGIGVSFLPEVLDLSLADEIVMVHDDDSFEVAKKLAAREGLLAGGSAGANTCAALRIARRLGPGTRVVTFLCDTAERYLSKGRLGGPPP